MISIWEHLRDPVLSFSQESDCRVIERTLTVIMNSCQVKKSWFVPVSKGMEDPETQALREEQYTGKNFVMQLTCYSVPGLFLVCLL